MSDYHRTQWLTTNLKYYALMTVSGQYEDTNKRTVAVLSMPRPALSHWVFTVKFFRENPNVSLPKISYNLAHNNAHKDCSYLESVRSVDAKLFWIRVHSTEVINFSTVPTVVKYFYGVNR